MNHDKFSVLSGQLCNILYLKNYDKDKVNSFLDELNAVPYNAEVFVYHNDGTTLITALCLNISSVDGTLVTKASNLMSRIISKQNLQLTDRFLIKVVNWHVISLHRCVDIVLPNVLYNLQCILHYNHQVALKFSDVLIGKDGLLLKFINGHTDTKTLNDQDLMSITLLTLKCACILTVPDENNKPDICLKSELKINLAEVITKYLLSGISQPNDKLYCKIVIYSLRVLAQIYFDHQLEDILLPDLMGICRYYLLFELIPQDCKPEKIMAAQQVIAIPAAALPQPRGGKKQRLRKHRNNAIDGLKKVSDKSIMKEVDNLESSSTYKPVSQNYLDPQRAKNNNTWTLTSDSDMSDVESKFDLLTLKVLQSRVRQSASKLLLVLIKVVESKDMFGYWWALLPDCPNPDNWAIEESSKRTLAYCAVSDPVASSRTAALSVVLALLSGSRKYLAQAESSKKETASFIPFSVTLGYTITCMHKVLTGILDNERAVTVLSVALKCCAALVQATPYHKMNSGLISIIVGSVRKFLFHKDVSLQVGALVTIGCVLSIDPKVDEVIKAVEKNSVNTKKGSELSDSTGDEECSDFEEGYSDDEIFTTDTSKLSPDTRNDYNFKSWILDICFKNIGWTFKENEVVKCQPAANPIVLESLQVLSSVAFHHFDAMLQMHMDLLADILSEVLARSEHDETVIFAAKTVSVIGDAIQKLEAIKKPVPVNQCVTFWEKMLTPLSFVLQCSNNSAAKAVVCDCIANIGEKPFEELPRRLQILCCTLLVGSCGSGDGLLEGAAVRALAMTVMYRSLREDICFVSDCGDNILRPLSDTTLVVRSKAAWGLGNLTDALVLNLEDPEINDIEDNLLLKLLQASIQCSADTDKIKMSATRALGNLLRLTKPEHLSRNPDLKSLCETAIHKLVESSCKAYNVKVRWNACYAMGNFMKNENIFTCFSGWQELVFTNLCNLTRECKNLKVRINAAVALRSPQTRAQYADHFILIWRSCMSAMDSAANVDDYNEHRHKDNLIEQLSVTLAHLCCLLTVNDLADIIDPLSFHYECAKSQMAQLCHKLPPENASCLKILEAAKYVTLNLTATSESQQHALGMLQEMFIWEL